MDIFERLPQKDVEKLNSYINYYGGGGDYNSQGVMPLEMTKHFLRYWSAAKAPLYKTFGEQFILKREVSFDKKKDDLADELDYALWSNDSLIRKFVTDYLDAVNRLPISCDEVYALKRFGRDMDMLVDNVYDGPSITIPANCTIDGHALQINHGAKAVKMLGKIVKALNITTHAFRCEECNHMCWEDVECPICGNHLKKMEGYEAFRRAHSLVLNQKVIRGNLCLSIHPLDYITMSDNDSGWESCMRWMEDPGDYRLGTIEMMNSEYVIVAYVEAKDDMIICNRYTWNNKRWRQLIILTPELVLGNKQYPYVNDFLQGTALKWVRQLAEATGAYGPYSEEIINLYNHQRTPIGTRQVAFDLDFNYMYNDIYDSRLAFVKRNWSANEYRKNLSGPAVCTCCGDVIPFEDVDPSWTTCRDCNGMWKCDCCGDWCTGDIYYSDDDDRCYCDYCYHHELIECEVCGGRTSDHRTVYIQLDPDLPEEYEYNNWTYAVYVCNSCLQSDEFVKLFGKPQSTTDMWGRDRTVIALKNITDEGLRKGCLRPHAIEKLTQVRDSKSLEERLEVILNYL